MNYFIFEEQIKGVTVKSTREYLEEMIDLYNNRKYRASIIMLYSIVWHDLMKKIEFLSEMYQDDKAKKFLEEFTNNNAKNIKYSDLEKRIFNFAKERGFINAIEEEQINQLKSTRDYCAHPVFKNNFELITPNREQVAAHTRNMFEAVFLKDAILNKKIFEELLTKSVDFYERNKLEGLARYLDDRYFKRINETAKKDICKQLWRMSFYSTDYDVVNNRECIYYSLCCLINTEIGFFMNYIEQEKEWFNSKILFEKIKLQFKYEVQNKDNKPILYFIELIIRYPKIYEFLLDSNKVEVENIINKNINLLIRCTFLSDDLEKHMQKCLMRIIAEGNNWCVDGEVFIKLYKKLDAIGYKVNPLKRFAIEYFYKSMNGELYRPDYDYINWTYRDIISKIIDDFDEEEKRMFVEGFRRDYKQAHCYSDIERHVIKFKRELEIE